MLFSNDLKTFLVPDSGNYMRERDIGHSCKTDKKSLQLLAFLHVSKTCIQINFIFSDKVHILYIYTRSRQNNCLHFGKDVLIGYKTANNWVQFSK